MEDKKTVMPKSTVKYMLDKIKNKIEEPSVGGSGQIIVDTFADLQNVENIEEGRQAYVKNTTSKLKSIESVEKGMNLTNLIPVESPNFSDFQAGIYCQLDDSTGKRITIEVDDCVLISILDYADGVKMYYSSKPVESLPRRMGR